MKTKKISKILYIGGITTVAFALLATLIAPLTQDMDVKAHAPQLTIQKVGNKSVIKSGDTLKFTITVTNHGDPDFVAGHNDMTAYDVVVTDNLPAGFTRSSDGSSSLTWTVGKLNVGQTWQKTFQAKTSANMSPGGYLNVATVKAKHKVNGSWVNYPTQRATFAVVVEKAPEPQTPKLTVDKTVDKSNINAGQTVIYSIAVNNTGNGAANNLTLVDNLPNGFKVLSSGNNSIQWTKNTLSPGASWTQTFTAQSASTLSTGTYVNTATVSASNHGFVSDTAAVSVQNNPVITNPSLSINKTTSTSAVNAGGVARYSVSVTNSGNGTAVNVILTDTMPSGFTHTTNGQTVRTWNLGNIVPGETKNVNYSANIAGNVASGSYINTAVAKASNHGFVSDTASVMVQNTPVVTNPVLFLNKVANTASVNAGGTATYTITVTNSGSATALNAVLFDDLPNGFTYTTTGQNTRSWSLGNLSSGETKTLSYTASVASSTANGFYTNTATVTAQNHSSLTDTATVRVVGQVLGDEFDPSLVIEKTANMKAVNPGGTVTYTITVKNFGEADAVNVTLKDVLPAGFSEIDTGNTSITWTHGLLEKNGGTWQVSYRARVAGTISEGNYVNTAVVYAENHSNQVKADYLVQVRKGEVLGDTGITLLQIVVWLISVAVLATAGYQIRRKFVSVRV